MIFMDSTIEYTDVFGVVHVHNYVESETMDEFSRRMSSRSRIFPYSLSRGMSLLSHGRSTLWRYIVIDMRKTRTAIEDDIIALLGRCLPVDRRDQWPLC